MAAGLTVLKKSRDGQTRPSTQFAENLKRWLKTFRETFQKNNSLSELQIEAYATALKDLSVDELNKACEKVLRTWTMVAMPPPGFIRECLETGNQERLGPAQLTYPDVSPEEREAALEFSTALKKLLNKKDEASTATRPQFNPISSAEFEKQLAEYQEWLVAAAEEDKIDRVTGLSPVPRSEAERLAIYLAQPLETRRKIARSGEWAKLDAAIAVKCGGQK